MSADLPPLTPDQLETAVQVLCASAGKDPNIPEVMRAARTAILHADNVNRAIGFARGHVIPEVAR